MYKEDTHRIIHSQPSSYPDATFTPCAPAIKLAIPSLHEENTLDIHHTPVPKLVRR